jgi:ubiquinone/menaquinone biosynthesis C-methylase UbiE
MKAFDLIAPWYGRLGPFERREEIIRHARLPVQGRLLDAGGGSGRVAQALCDQAGGVVVADLSMRMLYYAANHDGIRPVRADAARLPFPDGAFERILMRDAFHHVSAQAATLQELWRVLAPGGRLLIVEPNIEKISGKLIALFEKVVLLNSHFHSAEQIAVYLGDAAVNVEIENSGGEAWVAFDKAV